MCSSEQQQNNRIFQDYHSYWSETGMHTISHTWTWCQGSISMRGHCGSSNPGPYVGKLALAYRQTDGWHFTVQNHDQLYLLVSSAHKTTRCDMTYTVVKVTLKTK